MSEKFRTDSSDASFNEKNASSGYSPYFPSTISAASHMSSKPIPQIVELQGAEYSFFGKLLLRFSPITFVLSTAATFFYLFVRGSYIVKAHKATGNTFAAAWLFFASEALFGVWICKRT